MYELELKKLEFFAKENGCKIIWGKLPKEVKDNAPFLYDFSKKRVHSAEKRPEDVKSYHIVAIAHEVGHHIDIGKNGENQDILKLEISAWKEAEKIVEEIGFENDKDWNLLKKFTMSTYDYGVGSTSSLSAVLNMGTIMCSYHQCQEGGLNDFLEKIPEIGILYNEILGI